MERVLLKSKISGAVVTAANVSSDLPSEDALYLDREIMKRADIWPFERVEVCNLENGARFMAYVSPAEAGSGTLALSGACAYLAQAGSRLLIHSHVMINEAELSKYAPRLVTLEGKNRLRNA